MTEIMYLYDPNADARMDREVADRLAELPLSPLRQLVEANVREIEASRLEEITHVQRLAAKGLADVLKANEGESAATEEGIETTRKLIAKDHGINLALDHTE
jgi:hypothetical protein